MNYEITDNFIDTQNFQQLSKHILSSSMPWFFQYETTRNAGDEPFFSHIFYQNMKPVSPLYDQAIHSILKNLNAGLVYNLRGNLYYNTGKKEKSARHIDVEYDGIVGKTSILYINTNNGGTKLYQKGKKSVFVNSVANRLVTFDSDTEHEAVWQTDSKVRVVINFNYIIESQKSLSVR